MEDKERNLFNLDDLDESSSELKSKDESSSQNLTLDEFETNELDKEELLTQKIKEAAAKRKLTAQNGENEKRKWTKIFERKNALKISFRYFNRVKVTKCHSSLRLLLL